MSLDEVPLFRGAILSALPEKGDVVFHNHVGDSYRYTYPLVQYKSIDAKAALFLLGEATDQLMPLLQLSNQRVNIGHRSVMLSVDRVYPSQTEIGMADPVRYRIEQWLPLNEENDKEFLRLESDEERFAFLERMLTGNLLSMAKGLNFFFDEKVECHIESLDHYQHIVCKNIKMMAFDAVFTCNLSLPEYMGLGKHASFGYGLLKKIE